MEYGELPASGRGLATNGIGVGGIGVGEWLRGFAKTRAYDALMRLPLVVVFFFLALAQCAGISARFQAARLAQFDAPIVAELASRVAVLLFLVLIVAVTLTRSRPTKKAPGLQPRLTALAGTFLLLGLVLFPRNEATMAMNLLSAGLIVSGNLLAVYVLFWLGRSFSVMAEARRLVTGGPYALIRHPLYVAEEIAILGVFVVYASPWTAILFTVHLALQIQRMRNEEEILCRAFPAYQDYMTRTARLIPRLY